MPDEKTNPGEDSANPAPQGNMQRDATDTAAQANAELEALIAQNSDMRDRLLRTMADMENLRRRAEQEKKDTARYAMSNFARDLLTVGDNLRRTIEHVPPEATTQDPALRSFLGGVEITERELLNALERHGVRRFEPLGQPFDPNCQQAMFKVQNPGVPEGTVVDVMQPGYLIDDRCLRPALVAVAQGEATAGTAGPGGEAQYRATDQLLGGKQQD
jgi:molecular chaperone GrpE